MVQSLRPDAADCALVKGFQDSNGNMKLWWKLCLMFLRDHWSLATFTVILTRLWQNLVINNSCDYSWRKVCFAPEYCGYSMYCLHPLPEYCGCSCTQCTHGSYAHGRRNWGGGAGGRVLRSRKISVPPEIMIFKYLFFLTYIYENVAFSNIFKTKWPKSEEKLTFGGRWAWVPKNPSPQTKLRGDAPAYADACNTRRVDVKISDSTGGSVPQCSPVPPPMHTGIQISGHALWAYAVAYLWLWGAHPVCEVPHLTQT